jgi:hypothetical protein
VSTVDRMTLAGAVFDIVLDSEEYLDSAIPMAVSKGQPTDALSQAGIAGYCHARPDLSSGYLNSPNI